MPHFAPWQWLLGSPCAYMIGIAKTGAWFFFVVNLTKVPIYIRSALLLTAATY